MLQGEIAALREQNMQQCLRLSELTSANAQIHQQFAEEKVRRSHSSVRQDTTRGRGEEAQGADKPRAPNPIAERKWGQQPCHKQGVSEQKCPEKVYGERAAV